jgi:hypothetical protein
MKNPRKRLRSPSNSGRIRLDRLYKNTVSAGNSSLLNIGGVPTRPTKETKKTKAGVEEDEEVKEDVKKRKIL